MPGDRVAFTKKIVYPEFVSGITTENEERALVFFTPAGEANVFPVADPEAVGLALNLLRSVDPSIIPDEAKQEFIKHLSGGIVLANAQDMRAATAEAKR